MPRTLHTALVLIAAFALSSCVLTPGKFVSKLTINADRSFAFTYTGQVIALDMDDPVKGLGDSLNDDGAKPADNGDADTDKGTHKIALQDDGKAQTAAQKKAVTEAKNRAIAEALSREAGYRKVTYMGDGVFDVDYAISGTLTHSFIYPFNIDAEAVFPFIAVELRANGTVRMKAPAFGNEDSSKSMPGSDQAQNRMDGSFTLDTDAEIVSQNSEDGATTNGSRKVIIWRATPASKSAPMAVLRFPAGK